VSSPPRLFFGSCLRLFLPRSQDNRDLFTHGHFVARRGGDIRQDTARSRFNLDRRLIGLDLNWLPL
jgi:hypothetical protein